MQNTTVRTLAILAVASTLAISGCKPKPAAPVNSSEQTNKAAASGPAGEQLVPVSGPTGSVEGVVTLSGKPPAKVEIDTSMDPACGMSGHGPLYTEQYVVDRGKLANVFVYVKSGLPAAMHAAPASTAPSVMDQAGCRYIPHVLGVMQGGQVDFKNSDPTMHNVHTMPITVGNHAIDISMGPRGSQTETMNKPENLIPVRCNNHPWMNAFIDVAPTPFFQVTGTDGKFDLKGLPPGDYEIGAVQEKLGEKTIHVTVTADKEAKADFSYSISH